MTTSEVERALAVEPSERGIALLGVAEDQWFERKSFRVEPRRLAEAIVAFANAEGGLIAIGLSSGRVEGTGSDPRHRNALMQASIDFTQPVVPVTSSLLACVNADGSDDALLVVNVAPSASVHSSVRDEVFLRVGDETRRLSFGQRRDLLFDKGQSVFETERSAARPTDLDRELLVNYAERVGAPDPDRLLVARGLVAGAHLTVAGCLLFAENPGRWLPNAHIRISRFRGHSRGLGSRQNLASDRRIEGPVPRALVAAREAVRAVQPTRQALTDRGTFGDVALVPEDAWLEGLVNAAVHRSYSLGGDHIHVDVFDDRIEIESPGRFPGLVDLSDPRSVTRFARNPRIARVCADLKLGQEFGEGIRRMYEEMRLAALDEPLYRQTSGSVHLTLSGAPTHRRLDDQLPASTRAITIALREAGQLSTGDIAELLGVARPTAIRHLQRLRGGGLIEWVGKSPRDPRAYWRLR